MEMSARNYYGKHTVTSVLPALFILIRADGLMYMSTTKRDGFLQPRTGVRVQLGSNNA
jgi:tRNA(His) 5'-end guanylyltransferase